MPRQFSLSTPRRVVAVVIIAIVFGAAVLLKLNQWDRAGAPAAAAVHAKVGGSGFMERGGSTTAQMASTCPQLVWVRDDGSYSTWQATVPVNVTVVQTRRGSVVGSTTTLMRKDDQMRMLIWDGQNGDGFQTCTTFAW